MSPMKIKVGDKVQLPVMEVTHIRDDYCECEWMDSNREKRIGRFPLSCIEKFQKDYFERECKRRFKEKLNQDKSQDYYVRM